MAGYNPDDYELVEVRLEKFWKENPDGKVKTKLVESSEDGLMVICYAEIYEHKDDTEPKARRGYTDLGEVSKKLVALENLNESDDVKYIIVNDSSNPN